jgi:L-threonylcarbamoyladenylate synthase
MIIDEEIKKAVEILKQGGVVMHVTETCYGLAADVFNEDALKKLYRLKRMARNKPVSMMVRNLEEGRKYAEFGDLAVGLAEKFWPGPLTLILPRKDVLPDFFNSEHGTVGIRCPDSDVSQALIDGMDGPLTTTSANISGQPEVYSVNDSLGVDLILESGEIEKNKPSTVVKIVGDEIEIIREGGIKI